jgi:hypothetical protein
MVYSLRLYRLILILGINPEGDEIVEKSRARSTSLAAVLAMIFSAHYGNNTLRRRPRAMSTAFCRGRRRILLDRNPIETTVGV